MVIKNYGGFQRGYCKLSRVTGKQVAKTDNKSISGDLIGDTRRLIATARHNVAVTVNAGLTILYPDRRKSRL